MYGRNLSIVAVIGMLSIAPAHGHPLAVAAEANRAHAACPHARAKAARWAKPLTSATPVASKTPIQVSAGGSSLNVRRFVPDLLP